MNAEVFQKLLRELRACSEAVKWAEGKSLAEVWEQCERADWLLWLCVKMMGEKGWPTHEEIVLVTCDIVETSLHFFEEKYPDDKRPRQAIEASRAWANCNPKDKKKKLAAAAAWRADAAAAAWRADAAAAAAADAAAAWRAEAEAWRADAAAWRSTYWEKMKEFANVVRKRLKVPQ
jgi:hypothetical protein